MLLTIRRNLDIVFRNFLEFDTYLRSSIFVGTRIMYEKPVTEFEQFLALLARFIPQRFSWDNLLISEAGLRLLLSHFKIFPALIDVVNAFGAQTSSESDSIRQMGVYH